MTNYYQILGVSNFSSSDEIKTAYRQVSKKWHPDLNNGSAYHTEKFKELQEAYSCLSDEQKRYVYDQRLRDYLSGYHQHQYTYTDKNRYDGYTATTPPPSHANGRNNGTGISGRWILRIIYLLLIVVRATTCHSSHSYEPDASSSQISPAIRVIIDSIERANGDTLLNGTTPPVPNQPALSR